MEILHRDDLPLGGFAGLRERRLVMDANMFGSRAGETAWPGIGNFVYLADANFQPHGDTTLHGHREVDVITFVVEGRMAHEGSLAHGGLLSAPDIQVQRAGGEGFSHNEVNPDDTENRILQLWVLPEKKGEPAGYQTFSPQQGKPLCVYGGDGSGETYASSTRITAAFLGDGERLAAPGNTMAYIARGAGNANGEMVREGDLLRGNNLEFHSKGKAYVIAIQAK